MLKAVDDPAFLPDEQVEINEIFKSEQEEGTNLRLVIYYIFLCHCFD